MQCRRRGVGAQVASAPREGPREPRTAAVRLHMSLPRQALPGSTPRRLRPSSGPAPERLWTGPPRGQRGRAHRASCQGALGCQILLAQTCGRGRPITVKPQVTKSGDLETLQPCASGAELAGTGKACCRREVRGRPQGGSRRGRGEQL